MNRGRISLLIAAMVVMVAIGLTAYISRPLPPSRLDLLSHVIKDASGDILATRISNDGFWREKVSLNEIDSKLTDTLLAYEDKRFWSHVGVDPLAIVRAVIDALISGHITSGASTITMQTARLMYPELGGKTIRAKIHQMLMALRVEFHWSKKDILEAYFTLAPYGGNIEGITAGTRAWLGRPPKHLTYREAAFFVALPQSPERRRPDRHLQAAEDAASRVLAFVAERLGFSKEQLNEYQSEPTPIRKLQWKLGDVHLIDRLSSPGGGSLVTTLNGDWQSLVRATLKKHINYVGLPYNAAAMVVERKTGRIQAYVASTDYQNKIRKGANNYLTAVRSPGSTLKPLIYGMALERGLLSVSSVMKDTKIQVDSYAPTNFDDRFHGAVSLKDALIQSLNIPAINTLETLGPAHVTSAINAYLQLPSGQANDPGLSLAVGGLYLTAEQLSRLYLGMVDHPSPDLHFMRPDEASMRSPLISQKASNMLMWLLSQVNISGERYIVKTGTSNERRDVWSVHILKDHIIVVWLGAPDNQASQHITGARVATPIGFEIAEVLSLKPPIVLPIDSSDSSTRVTVKPACERLIEYPEDNEWIISSSTTVTIGSRFDNLIWYLNGKQVVPVNGSIRLEHFGVNTLSARRGKCTTSTNIFVQRLTK